MPTGDTGLTAFLMDLSTGEMIACGNLESVEMEMTTTEQEEAVGLFDTREISFEIEDKSVIEQLLEAFRPKPKETLHRPPFRRQLSLYGRSSRRPPGSLSLSRTPSLRRASIYLTVLPS